MESPEGTDEPVGPGIAFRTDRLTAEHPGEDAIDRLQEVFRRSGDYFQALIGRPEPEPDAAAREVSASASSPGRNIVLLCHAELGDVGALGWWEGKPDEEAALLGMLTIVPDHRGDGLGSEAVDGLARLLASRGLRRIHAAAAAHDEQATRVVRGLGFHALDARRHVDVPQGRLMIALYERNTDAPPTDEVSRSAPA